MVVCCALSNYEEEQQQQIEMTVRGKPKYPALVSNRKKVGGSEPVHHPIQVRAEPHDMAGHCRHCPTGGSERQSTVTTSGSH